MKELSSVPDIAVGGMSRSAIDKAKGMRRHWEMQAIGQPRSARRHGVSQRYGTLDMAGEFFTAGTNSIGAIEELYL